MTQPPFYTVDVGNTHFTIKKHALEDVIDVTNVNELADTTLDILISCVGVIPPEIGQLNPITYSDHFKLGKFLDMPVKYSKGLGDDRLYAAYYAYKTLTGTTLVIDAGTFLTIDLINSDLGLEGGLIFPGPEHILNSFSKGAKLPQIELDLLDFKSFDLANNTISACLNSSNIMLKGLISEVLSRYEYDRVLLTGGWGEKLIQLIEDDSISVEYSKDIIHRALALIHTAS